MTDQMKYIINSVVDGDIERARRNVRLMLSSSTSKKDAAFCKKMLLELDRRLTFVELPASVKGLLIAEDLEVSFRDGRYYLSESEKKIFEQIKKSYTVAGKLREFGIPYKNSCLLYGESGTGKTTFGKYVAHHMNLPFYYISFARLIDSMLGGTGKNIQKCFDFVGQKNCVLMMDEFDAVGASRSSGKNEVGEMNRIVISLMQSIDTLPNGVVLLGATNRKDIIDAALLRRFAIKHEVKRADMSERYALGKKFLDDINFDCAANELHIITDPEQTQSELMNRLVSAVADRIYREIG